MLETASLTHHETVESLLRQPDEGWDPDVAEYAFSCWLRCAAPKCGGFVAVVGRGFEDAGWDDRNGTTWEPCFRPECAWPMPPVFTLPATCPESVAAEVRSSFSLCWSDQPAAASRLRVSLEHLLDEIGIQRKRRASTGYEALSLHKRLEVLSGTQPKVAANLMAIKWLGNTGSHESSVALEDLLKGYEIMEHALDTLLGQRAKRVAAFAKDLTRRHAPKRQGKK